MTTQTGVIGVSGTPAALPFAPTLVSPANGSYLDLSGTPTFVWQYNPGQVGLTQTGYIFERITNGGGTQYWNNGTQAWQSTTVTNSQTGQSLTFPAGSWVDGNVYQWSVATVDANGTAAFAPFFTLNSQAVPQVTVLTPFTFITTADPAVTWSEVLAGAAVQTSFRVIIYTSAQVHAGGFSPGSGPSVYDTGVVGSSALQFLLSSVPFYLANGTTYYAYVQITQTGGQASAWASSFFSTQFSAPNTPGVTAAPGTDPSTGVPRIAVAVTGHDNYATQVDSYPSPSNLGSWAPVSNCTLIGVNGGFEMQSVAAGTMSAETGTGTAGYAVQPSTQYTAISTFAASGVGTERLCSVGIAWYTAAGALISTSTGGTITDTPAGVQATVTATSPSNAAFATLVLTVQSTAGALEQHQALSMGLFLGTWTTWCLGGFVGLVSAVILRSDGLYVRYASLLNPAQLVGTSDSVTVYDYEPVPNVEYTYTVYLEVTYAVNKTVISPTATSSQAEVTTTSWWEIDPTNYASAVSANVVEWNPVTNEQSAANLVMGQTVPNIVANVMGAQDGSGTFQTFNDANYLGLKALLEGGKTVFVSSPWGAADSGYVRFGPQSGGLSAGTGNRVRDTKLQRSIVGAGVRLTDVNFVAQYRPAV